MQRRKFIAGLAGAAAWPMATRAQQPAMPVIGVLSAVSQPSLLAAFQRGLAEIGYVEGRNVMIMHRSVEGEYDRLPSLAHELVRLKAAVIVTMGTTPAALAAKSATSSIPIVFALGYDPVETGLVASFTPGGNITGVTNLVVELAPKRLELLHEMVPTASLIAVLTNPLNVPEMPVLQRAAEILGVRLLPLNASSQSEVDKAFATLREQGAGALLVGAEPTFFIWREQLSALAARYAVPAIYFYRENVDAGGLMSYAPDRTETYRQVGVYAGRILKGDKPAELPVQRPTKFEMVVNLKTAKALGLNVPVAILIRADALIE